MIFIDTGAFLARYLSQDQYHSEAELYWKEIQHHKTLCYTSNFVLNELITLLSRRVSYEAAAKVAKMLFQSQTLVIERPDQHDEAQALHQFTKFADQKVSYTDCLSSVLMKRAIFIRSSLSIAISPYGALLAFLIEFYAIENS